MKKNIIISLRLTVVSIVFFCGFYTLVIWGFAQFAPDRGCGKKVYVNNRVVGYALEGQGFTEDKYFWSRPSACRYNAAGSSASNKGPSNPDYLNDVQSRIDTFMVHNPTVKKEAIPSELVTASGSGLDPDLSPEAAYVQIPRIAHSRKVDEERIRDIVDLYIQKPLLGLFGTARINVLQLNMALDKLN